MDSELHCVVWRADDSTSPHCLQQTDLAASHIPPSPVAQLDLLPNFELETTTFIKFDNLELTNLVSTGTTVEGTQEQKISQQSLKKNFIYCLLKFCYITFIDDIINIDNTVVEVIT